MGRRFEQDLTRDFDGRIDEPMALELGAYELVSTALLASRLSKVTRAIKSVRMHPVDMSLRELDGAIGLVDMEREIGAHLRHRNPRKVARLRRRLPIHFGHIPGIRANQGDELDPAHI